MRTPDFFDLVCLFGFWSWWQLIFKTKIPFGPLRQRIYDRWPPDGHLYLAYKLVPHKRVSKFDRDAYKYSLKGVGELPRHRERLVEEVGTPALAPHWKDGKIERVKAPVSQLPNLDGTPNPAKLTDLDHPHALSVTQYRVAYGEGSVFTTAFTCLECSPRWVLFAAMPLWQWAHSWFLALGFLGTALIAGEFAERRRTR